MEWMQVLALIGSMAALMFWFRSESRADHRQLEASVNAQLMGIREEMKDFHGRLCAIEAARK